MSMAPPIKLHNKSSNCQAALYNCCQVVLFFILKKKIFIYYRNMAGAKLRDDINNIPLADDDPQVIIFDEPEQNSLSEANSSSMNHGRSMDSIQSTFTNGSLSPQHHSLEQDSSPDEQEEKARLISQVLELQNTLDDLSQRVDSVKEENLKLRSENQVLGQYIENLMSASSVFQSTSPKIKKK